MMMKTKLIVSILLAVTMLFLAGGTAQADILNPTKDNVVYTDTARNLYNCGGNGATWVGTSYDDCSTITTFDLSGIDFTIDSATLRLYNASTTGIATQVDVFAMHHTANNASWAEGSTSNGLAADGESCGLYREYDTGDNDLQWENASGVGQADYTGAFSTTSIGSIGPSSWAANNYYEWTLDASTIESYRTHDSITLRVANVTNSITLYFRSRTHTGGSHPELVVTPEPATLSLLLLGLPFALRRRR